jgi:hypothetical protein
MKDQRSRQAHDACERRIAPGTVLAAHLAGVAIVACFVVVLTIVLTTALALLNSHAR